MGRIAHFSVMYITHTFSAPVKVTVYIFLFIYSSAHATDQWADTPYPIPELLKANAETCSMSVDGWGYNFSDLEKNLHHWAQSPFVLVDSIGQSIQGRPLYLLTITNGLIPAKRSAEIITDKPRVFIHARTHPSEVQSSRIATEIITFLLDTTLASHTLREKFVFNILPMYNPDGVELGCERVNAADINLESAFDANPLQPETAALKGAFQRAMNSENPIRVALNLHSSKNICRRFFFFHQANGTSEAFAGLEKDFIRDVQYYFPGGIEDWNLFTSWSNSTPSVYPESFFWNNYAETVMALTFEDINDQDPSCPIAGAFDSTAKALILGSADYIRKHSPFASTKTPPPDSPFPGPIHSTPHGLFFPLLNSAEYEGRPWKLFTPHGKLIAKGVLQEGTLIFNPDTTPTGPLIFLLAHNRKLLSRLFIIPNNLTDNPW
ncbi:MAG: hypothetical protein HQK83_00360 [Fibrobacteria bacterium]|nr:hypothetical protein [Fibrobacteria bacterium]